MFLVCFFEVYPSSTIIYKSTMSTGGCRNESVNRELKRAREAYETQVSAREKKIISEMEAEVNEEQEKPDMQSIEEEIEWIAYLGTLSTRAT